MEIVRRASHPAQEHKYESRVQAGAEVNAHRRRMIAT